MKITPLDIQQREFKGRFRGYDREEVQAFLRSVSQTVEEMLKENIALKEHADKLYQEVGELRKKEAALSDLLVTTQTMAESLKETARKEADLILLDAPDFGHIGYRFGTNLVSEVIRGGRIVV